MKSAKLESTRWTLYSFANYGGSTEDGLAQYTLISNLNGKDVIAGIVIQVTPERIFFLGDPQIVEEDKFLGAFKDSDLRIDDSLYRQKVEETEEAVYTDEEDIENEEESDSEE